jgi:hypothetical protein
VARHERCHRRRQQILDLEHYLDVLGHKPGALAGSKPLKQWRESGRWPTCYDEIWERLRARHGRQNGTRAMVAVVALGREFGHDRLRAAVAAVRYLLTEAALQGVARAGRCRRAGPLRPADADGGRLRHAALGGSGVMGELQSEAIHAAPHVGGAGGEPNAHPGGRHHRLRRTDIMRRSAARLTSSSTLTRTPPASSISINPDRRGVATLKGVAAGVDGVCAMSGDAAIPSGNKRIADRLPYSPRRHDAIGRPGSGRSRSAERRPARVHQPQQTLDSATTFSRNATSCARRRSPTISIRGTASLPVAATVAASCLPLIMPRRRSAPRYHRKAALGGRIRCS